MKHAVFLDFAASTPLDNLVLGAMQPYFSENFYNPSALYLASRAVKKDLESARSRIAAELGARPSEIIFTAGGSEANNLAIKGVMQLFPGKKLLISPIEHESIREPAKGFLCPELKVDKFGMIDLEVLRKNLDDSVVLVSIIYASNELGTIQPIAKIGQLIKETLKDRKRRGVDLPLYFHTDACQAVQYLSIAVDRLGVDLMTINGGKIYGPKQSGALYARRSVKLQPMIEGGGQEKNRRSGTENVAANIGLMKALEISRNMVKKESERVTKLRDELAEGLSRLSSSIIIHGHPKSRTPNHLAFSIPGFDNERLMMKLDELGFMVATGSACSASKTESSHALLAIGATEDEARSSIRITLGRTTTSKQLKDFLGALGSVIK